MTPTLSGIAEELERLDKLATPGPWNIVHDEYCGHYDIGPDDQTVGQIHYVDNEPGGRGGADAKLVIALRNNLPAFIEAANLIRTAEDRERELAKYLRMALAVIEASKIVWMGEEAARQALGGTNA